MRDFIRLWASGCERLATISILTTLMFPAILLAFIWYALRLGWITGRLAAFQAYDLCHEPSGHKNVMGFKR